MATSRFAALFVASVLPCDGIRKRHAADATLDSTSDDLLVPVSTERPDKTLFPARDRDILMPEFVDSNRAPFPLQTNKFWANWILNWQNSPSFSIHPAPYVLRWREDGALHVMRPETEYQKNGGNKVNLAVSPWIPDFAIGATEGFSGSHKIVREGHFGIHAERTGNGCTATYPIYAGMAYVSSQFSGECTPEVTTEYFLQSVTKIRAGVWEFQSSRKTYRVYALKNDSSFVDDSYDFDSDGKMNKRLEGWLRLAIMEAPSDAAVLDDSATTILTDWYMRIQPGRLVYYFLATGPSDKFLHWGYANHAAFLRSGAQYASGLQQTRSAVKGLMFPFLGSTEWTMAMDISEASRVSFLPAANPNANDETVIREEMTKDFEYMKGNWRRELHKNGHYFSGKGYQKLGTLCHMMAKYLGKDNADTQECAGFLKTGFQCMYDRSVSDGSDRGGDPNVGCNNAPVGTWYDTTYGGIPSRDYDAPTCMADFGNSCYNDHHYHYGYFVVAGAMIVDLIPSMAQEARFVELVEMFIRDVGNPSNEDRFFPQFRAFDWFDMHSWSRGLIPDISGKDQESTSEEVNFHYGLKLWGDVTGNRKQTDLGATMLAATKSSLQEYFLMTRDNKNHPFELAINHVTGIFFQNRIHVTTWFGDRREYIHGIQMLPLTAGLTLSRTPKFAYEEWLDEINALTPIDYNDPWWSILLSGNLAMHDPERAFEELRKMQIMDDGLLRSWALYWTAIQEKYAGHDLPGPP